MQGKAKIRVKLEVEVDVGFEFDPLFRQASIIDAKISSNNLITPRSVYGAMSSGDYALLDSEAKSALKKAFSEAIKPYLDAQLKDFPVEEIRSCPLPPAEWVTMMKFVRNSRLAVTQVSQAVHQLRLLVEPVLCRTPTIYLWPATPDARWAGCSDEDWSTTMEKIKTQMNSVRASNIEEKEDGSIKVTWKYPI